MESTTIICVPNLPTANLPALPEDSRDDAHNIITELQQMLDFLSKAEHHGSGRENSQKLQTVADTVRELAYDAEDCIDELMLCKEGDRAGGYFEPSKNFLSKFKTRRVTKQLRELRSRVMDVSNQLQSFDQTVPSTSSMPVVADPPLSPLDARAREPTVQEFPLVGMVGPRDELFKLLTEEENHELASRLKVVTIVGHGGMGKTTLALEVYRTTEARFDFDCRAWVHVSPRPDMKKLLIDMLHQVEDPHSRGSDGGEDDERDLIRKIRKSLQDKRYLFVLDDIWSSETWEIIQSAFPFNSLGSRIITTTRSNEVAASCCSQWNDHIYHIRPLSKQDSWNLFHRRIFGSVENCPPDLKQVSHGIMEKCSGVPLALTVMSGFLANKPRTTSTWKRVYDSIAVAPESTGSIRDVLLLCYETLPKHLKMCFLYLSIFPEDYVINHDFIVMSWIAEGFIEEDNRTSLQEKAENCLSELIDRNMIQPVRGSDDSGPGAFQIHPLMLDLIRYKSSEQNFVTLIYNREPVSVSYRKIRRLSIISGCEDHGISASMDVSHIRSLHIFGGVMRKLSFRHLTLLRVLNLNGCKDLKDRDIEEIAGLLLLRYLSIRETPISKLSDQIGRLQFLITLDLRGTEVKVLPSSVDRLPRLKYLLCDGVMSRK